jgi:hypothetical protein
VRDDAAPKDQKDPQPPKTAKGGATQGKGGSDKNAGNRNGHRPGGPKKISKKRNRGRPRNKRR